MSPQKKPAVKSAVKKTSRAIPRRISEKKAEKTLVKPQKKTASQPSSTNKSSSGREETFPAAGAAYVSQRGKYVYVSPLYERMTGFKASEILEASVLDHVHPDDRETVRKKHSKISADPYEYRFVRKDGGVVWLLEISGPFTFKNAKARQADVQDITCFKQNNELSAAEEERYRAILEQIAENYYEVDLKGNFTFVNDAQARNLGYSKKELIGMNYRTHCDATSLKKLRSLYKRLYKTGKPFEGYEASFVIRNGEIRVVELSGSVMRNQKGEPIGFRGTSRDVTDRKKMETELRIREERYRKILENIQEAYLENDLQGRITFVNDTACQHLGYSRQEMIGSVYHHFQDETDARKTFKAYSKLFQTGEPIKSLESVFIRKDGSRGTYDLSVDLIRDSRGKPTGFRSISRDITDRKRMEEVLRKSEERYRSILEATDEGFCELDLAGNVTFVNHAGARIVGYPPDRIIGTNFRQYVDPQAAEDLLVFFKTIYKTGRPFKRVEAVFVNKEGIRRYLEIAGAVIRDAEGKPAGFRGLAHDITERKWAEEALLQSEAKYFSIIESIGVAYFETDLTGVFTFINDRVCTDLGYSREELLRMSNRDLQDEVSAQETYAIFNEVYETGNPVRVFSYKAIRRDGTRAVFEISVSLMRDAQGKPIGFRGLSRDITQRQRMEDALRASEEKYRSIVESIVDGYVEVDLAGNWTFVNDVICRHVQYSRIELLGMDFHKLHTEKSAHRTTKAFAEVYQTGESIKALEIETVRKDGSVGFYELSVSLMKNADGTPAGFRCISRDINERKAMENALRASEERARAIIATIPDPYYETDLQGQVVYINAAFSNWMGYSLEELRQTNYMTYLSETNSAIVGDLYKTVYKTGLTMKNVEVEIVLKSGEKRLVNLSVSPIRDSQGGWTGFHGIARDITEKKKAEELIRKSEQSLREYSETLEANVRERTAELEKAKIAAEAASRAKSDFMANISHEFQTPLNAVIGFTKVLQDKMFGPLNAKQEEFMHYIADAGTTLSRIITEIIDATHAASGSLKLDLSAVSLIEALSKTTKMLAPQMEDKRLLLNVDVALDADISIEADEKKIHQIFFHLLSNAVKYTPEAGNINVSAVRTRKDPSGPEGVCIAIADTGIGIKKGDLPKLFQTFETLESPYTRSGKGIGVGLSLTKQLVELHSGTISVESEFGRGSCFTIFLPIKQKN